MDPIRQAFGQLIAAHDGALRQQLQHAATACARQDYAPAHALLAPLAAAGEAGAQFILGAFYLCAHGVVQDTDKAAAYWQQAAAQGDAHGQYLLGLSYIFADDAAAHLDDIHTLWHRAAAQGHEGAQEAL